jgi:hypothetical protein
MDPICAWITVCKTCGFQGLYNLWAGERALNRSKERKLALTVRHSNNKPTTEGVNAASHAIQRLSPSATNFCFIC